MVRRRRAAPRWRLVGAWVGTTLPNWDHFWITPVEATNGAVGLRDDANGINKPSADLSWHQLAWKS